MENNFLESLIVQEQNITKKIEQLDEYILNLTNERNENQNILDKLVDLKNSLKFDTNKLSVIKKSLADLDNTVETFSKDRIPGNKESNIERNAKLKGQYINAIERTPLEYDVELPQINKAYFVIRLAGKTPRLAKDLIKDLKQLDNTLTDKEATKIIAYHGSKMYNFGLISSNKLGRHNRYYVNEK